MPTYETETTEGEFCRAMVEKYRALMLKSAGLKSVNVDGQMVAFADLEAQYNQWRRKLAIINGERPQVLSINLENAQ